MNEAALRVLKAKNEQHWQARGRYATIYCLGIDSIRPHRRYVPDPNSGNLENAKIRPVEKNDGTQMNSDENFLLVVSILTRLTSTSEIYEWKDSSRLARSYIE